MFSNNVDEKYKSDIQQAFDKWDTIILGTKNENLSKIIINVIIDVEQLDQGVLGGASINSIYDINNYTDGTVYFYNVSKYGQNVFPHTGSFTLNSNSIENMFNNILSSGESQLYYVTLHEIGHILGIGNLWSYSNIEPPVEEYTDVNNFNFKLYTGENACREYQAIFPNLSLSGIPIENDGGSGTAESHLEEELNQAFQIIIDG